jgi:predicted transposase YdaD
VVNREEESERALCGSLRNDRRKTVLLAGVNLPLDAIVEAIRRRPMLDEIFEESSVAQWLIERGRKEGSEQGRDEGREEGRRQMARDMARMALESRFGTLSEEMLAALNIADEAALRDVVAHIGTDSLEQARSRLG